jgi:mono/diheme cytochrome c family protein
MADTAGPVGPTRKPEKVPAAIRPGDTDDVLEGPRLTRISVWGLLLSLGLALFIFLYWTAEPTRMTSTTKKFTKDSIRRGEEYFALPTNPVTGAANHRGIGCARCHGNDAHGGDVQYVDSQTNQKVQGHAPDLTTVFNKYVLHPQMGYKTPRDYIVATIERGRTNNVLGNSDDMPNWGQLYGGPLTDQQIGDIIDWLQTIQRPVSAASS